MTACLSPIKKMESATFSGSLSSIGKGFPVDVAQNLQPLVHTSPKIMNVAVRLLQHSPLFGHLPLLQIVCRQCCSTIRDTSAYDEVSGSLILSQSGFILTFTLS